MQSPTPISVGIDFGTSNSSVAYAGGDRSELLPLEDDRRTIPTAIFFANEDEAAFYGELAQQKYLAMEPGRYLRNLKKVLGTRLAADSTYALGREWAFTEIIGSFVAQLKSRAEANLQQTIDNVVLGRPVFFSERNPDADRAAQEMLGNIAHEAGFKQVEFMYEPVAAAHAITAEDASNREKLILIADLGGGTSDFSVLRAGPAGTEILANTGIVFGGSDIDRWLSLKAVMPLLGFGGATKVPGRQLPTKLYFDLATWHLIDSLYGLETAEHLTYLRINAKDTAPIAVLSALLQERRGHELAIKVEAAKVALSNAATAEVVLQLQQQRLNAPVSQDLLAAAVVDGIRRIRVAVQDCLKLAELPRERVDYVMMTGGTSLIPPIYAAFQEDFKTAEIQSQDVFGAVGRGLGLHAQRIFA